MELAGSRTLESQVYTFLFTRVINAKQNMSIRFIISLFFVTSFYLEQMSLIERKRKNASERQTQKRSKRIEIVSIAFVLKEFKQ